MDAALRQGVAVNRHKIRIKCTVPYPCGSNAGWSCCRHLARRRHTDLPDGLIFRIRVKPFAEKYFVFTETIITRMGVTSRAAQRGVSRSSRHVARDAMDAFMRNDEAQRRGRQKRVVPISRRWDQACRRFPASDGGYEARTPGR